MLHLFKPVNKSTALFLSLSHSRAFPAALLARHSSTTTTTTTINIHPSFLSSYPTEHCEETNSDSDDSLPSLPYSSHSAMNGLGGGGGAMINIAIELPAPEGVVNAYTGERWEEGLASTSEAYVHADREPTSRDLRALQEMTLKAEEEQARKRRRV